MRIQNRSTPQLSKMIYNVAEKKAKEDKENTENFCFEFSAKILDLQ